jgi:hypothetical protein
MAKLVDAATHPVENQPFLGSLLVAERDHRFVTMGLNHLPSWFHHTPGVMDEDNNGGQRFA